MNASAMKSKIKWNLTQLSPEEVEEVNNLVQSLLEQKKTERRIVNLEGIWEGIGFEKILDLEGEIKKIRKELAEQLLRRSERWNT
ncbi:hypothetical protein IH992_22520 [Candidatus Poribacteria bacterium]|nr:hypothetical protein [Candidatus Poribacteria bacterium]